VIGAAEERGQALDLDRKQHQKLVFELSVHFAFDF
jgi:hypothetical protein